ISGFLVVLLFGFCEHETKSKKPENENNDQVPISGYDLNHPSQSWKLPEQLKEISGIVKLGGDSLLAIEDLHANLYFLKLQNSSAAILANLPFAETEKDKFDIEDVAMIGDTVYALWSHASVFKIWNWKSKIQSKEYSTFLDKKNNTEGLAYDPVSGNLLIACKKESGDEDEKKTTRAVYEFDVKKGELKPSPFLLVEMKDFKKFIADKVEFFPSGIAVQPSTHDIYIISTRGNKCIACYNHSGQLKSFEYLDKDLLPQPEGICFDAAANLYISTEGKHGEAPAIYEFSKTK
ncbi:MAG TPA: SdiA-regulated domain-containing protein, partial [Chitinophagaceae bacterium]|nr:SdiA-regulated domain-containing protein [Chitinophagaceae bacterium]